MEKKLITEAKRARAERNAALYDDWLRMTADKDNSRTLVRAELMTKHHVYTVSTFYKIINEMRAASSVVE